MKQAFQTFRISAAALALLLQAVPSAAADDRAAAAHGIDGRSVDAPAAPVPPEGPD